MHESVFSCRQVAALEKRVAATEQLQRERAEAAAAASRLGAELADARSQVPPTLTLPARSQASPGTTPPRALSALAAQSVPSTPGMALLVALTLREPRSPARWLLMVRAAASVQPTANGQRGCWELL